MKPKSLPSRLFGRNSVDLSSETLLIEAAKYQRQVDCEDCSETSDQCACPDNQQVAGSSKQNKKSPREIHFSLLAEKYEPLMDDEAAKAKKEKKKKMRKDQYKKVKKNVGKALRATWKCLVLGLYSFALGYSTPITVAATFPPDFHRGRNRP